MHLSIVHKEILEACLKPRHIPPAYRASAWALISDKDKLLERLEGEDIWNCKTTNEGKKALDHYTKEK